MTMTITITKRVSINNTINTDVDISSLNANSEELPFIQGLLEQIKKFANSYPDTNTTKGENK